MFKTSIAQRVLLSNKNQLVKQTIRRYQQFEGPYKTGFERMVADKVSWARLETLSGMGFVFWGLANLGVFGLSMVMRKENFDYHFTYTGNGKFLQPFKSMMAAESINNVAWTAPLLIGGGLYLPRKVGSMTALKFFGLSLFASYAATCTFGPASRTSNMNIRWIFPKEMRWDSIDNDRKRMLGADLMAGCVGYSCLFASGYWGVGAALAVLDVAYYGPMGFGCAVPAAVAALTMF